jgi:hypothetical protein
MTGPSHEALLSLFEAAVRQDDAWARGDVDEDAMEAFMEALELCRREAWDTRIEKPR